MKRINIIHLITASEGGGAERMLEKIDAFAPKNHNHIIILLKGKNKLQVKNLYKFNFKKNPFQFIYEFLKLLKLFKKLKPDIAMSWLYHSDLLLMILGKIISIPKERLVWNVRCSYLDLKDYSFITKYILYFLSKFSNQVGSIIFNSFEGKQYHKKIGYKNKNMFVIPNGFNLRKFRRNTIKKNLLKKKYQINKNKTVGMFARNDPSKNFSIFLNLPHKIFLKKKLKIKFIVAGKNTHKLILPQNKKNLFLNLGYKKNVEDYLNILDVLILISKGEGFPNIIGEAMSMNVPVICNDVGDNRKIIENSGIIVSKKPNINEIRNSLINILLNKQKYSKGRTIIKNKYEINKISRLYENFFNSLMSSKI